LDVSVHFSLRTIGIQEAEEAFDDRIEIRYERVMFNTFAEVD
jgi:hypothetical protein